MTERLTQIKRLNTIETLRAHIDGLGIELPVADAALADGALSEPVTFVDARAGTLTSPNRFAVLPMEGWDGTTDGLPTDLVRRRWQRFADSGCGLVWGEATAVVPEGRANPNQLLIHDDSVIDHLAALRQMLAPGQVAGLQLTHSGRWARPDGSPRPRVAQRHPVLDPRSQVTSDDAVLSDGELDDLAQSFVAGAVRARMAGFDFVDVKCCHGYLLHELLGARDRAGRYGGDLDGRTLFLRSVVEGIRHAAPDLAIAVRLSAFDTVAFHTGPDGIGVPEATKDAPRPFGATDDGLDIDLDETHAFLDKVASLGIGLVCTTAGSPYYSPHIQRPAYFPPSDGYQPPEDPLVGVARQIQVTATLKAAHPHLTFIGSGYSYLQDWLPEVGQAVVDRGGADMIGLGRMILSYPDLAADVLAGTELERRLICRTFSDCTTAPRAGMVSGCYPLDEFYKNRPERIELAAVKRRLREARR